MGFFSWLTGKNAVDKTLDIADKTTGGIISGLDKMFYTKEEKAEAFLKRLEMAEKMSQTHIELMKVTHDETTTRSVTRRIVATSILAITFLSVVTISIVWRFNPQWAEFILKVIEYFQIGWSFIAVVIFFFGNHMITRFKK